MRIGFVGAGRIGRPMVARLVGAGHRVRALARSEPAGRWLTGAGATPIAAVPEVADGAGAVVVCVHTDEQVRAVCLEAGLVEAMPAGTVLVVHTTGSPDTAELLAERAAGRGIAVVDAPISGGPHDIEAGRVTLFVGGTAAGLQRARPVLSAYGDPVLHLGPVGSGQRVKLVNNVVFAANIGLVAQAVAVAARLGIAESSLLDGLRHGSADSRALAGIAGRGSVAAFAESVGEFVGKDIAVVRRVAAELGTDLGPLEDAYRVLGRLLTPADRTALAPVAGRGS
jgi:3-hydroxyisobutyrate dehydrogenase-like beta-hydroxyacid dehydrogenase